MTPLRFWTPALLVAALLLTECDAFARGGSGYYRYYQRFMRQSMQAMQKQAQAMQKQHQAEYDGFMKRFDTNKNGKIDGKEKGPAQKYLREVQLGIDPDKAVKTLGRSTSNSGTTQKRSSPK